MKNRSAIVYRRLSNVRKGLRILPDLAETAYPRYQKNHLLANQRGEKRMSKWLKYA